MKKKLLILTASLLLGSLRTYAASQSPVGTWDFVMSGAERGVAFINFAPDHTFSGIEIIAANNSFAAVDERGSGGDSRDGGNTNANSGNVLFGAYGVAGFWSFDTQKRVIGAFPEIGERIDGSTTNKITNSVSFVANVTTKRMTMKGSSGIGNVTCRGVRFNVVPN